MAPLLALLDVNGTLVMAGTPSELLTVPVGQLISSRRRLTGTSMGSVQETRDMLDLCAARDITAVTGIITAEQAMCTAFKRLEAGGVRYRLVLDASTL
ncbi:hypothetical protein ACFFS2_36050 [Streptomyces aurantiacus]|uniref:Alcohol dehydrogenase n=1 Tax=Streptomyces aurantiacus TaxID=47760 RepID=A0A7G1PEK1_9ACTN|nr:hypothetical protein [Streptomyces aurantiacus]BCL32177.1 hypothetical protein GCM10017557_70360 [Streptomyces aurantiacus]